MVLDAVQGKVITGGSPRWGTWWTVWKGPSGEIQQEGGSFPSSARGSLLTLFQGLWRGAGAAEVP